jgi:hypothetical protein
MKRKSSCPVAQKNLMPLFTGQHHNGSNYPGVSVSCIFRMNDSNFQKQHLQMLAASVLTVRIGFVKKTKRLTF